LVLVAQHLFFASQLVYRHSPLDTLLSFADTCFLFFTVRVAVWYTFTLRLRFFRVVRLRFTHAVATRAFSAPVTTILRLRCLSHIWTSLRTPARVFTTHAHIRFLLTFSVLRVPFAVGTPFTIHVIRSVGYLLRLHFFFVCAHSRTLFSFYLHVSGCGCAKTRSVWFACTAPRGAVLPFHRSYARRFVHSLTGFGLRFSRSVHSRGWFTFGFHARRLRIYRFAYITLRAATSHTVCPGSLLQFIFWVLSRSSRFALLFVRAHIINAHFRHARFTHINGFAHARGCALVRLSLSRVYHTVCTVHHSAAPFFSLFGYAHTFAAVLHIYARFTCLPLVAWLPVPEHPVARSLRTSLGLHCTVTAHRYAHTHTCVSAVGLYCTACTPVHIHSLLLTFTRFRTGFSRLRFSLTHVLGS